MTHTASDFAQVRLAMQVVIDAETAQRNQRPDLTWIEAERQAMHAAVNAERRTRGLPPTDIAAVERVERMAVGHSDYVHKFALYCAELAIGVKEPQP